MFSVRLKILSIFLLIGFLLVTILSPSSVQAQSGMETFQLAQVEKEEGKKKEGGFFSNIFNRSDKGGAKPLFLEKKQNAQSRPRLSGQSSPSKIRHQTVSATSFSEGMEMVKEADRADSEKMTLLRAEEAQAVVSAHVSFYDQMVYDMEKRMNEMAIQKQNEKSGASVDLDPKKFIYEPDLDKDVIDPARIFNNIR